MSQAPLVRHALLIAVSCDEPRGRLSVDDAVDRVAAMLVGSFGFVVERCVGVEATREGMLERLDRWIERCHADRADVCVLYYFGHGGRVRFHDLPTAAGDVLEYVTCHRIERADADGNRPFEAVLGVELSERLSALALAQPDRSVVALLDCCYAGQLVREGRGVETVFETAAPAWARAYTSRPRASLAIESHPAIVRLAGSTSRRESYVRTTLRGDIGVMSAALLETVEEFGPSSPQLSWDGVAHRVRQRVIDQVGEGQWVSYAGPRRGALLSTAEASLPPTVGLVADEDELGRAWLRAGSLSGVELGDRWAVVNPLIDAATQVLALGTVIEVELNRASVQFDGEIEPLRSNAAALAVCNHRIGVACPADATEWRTRLERSPWLRAVSRDEGLWQLDRAADAVILTDRDESRPPLRLPDRLDAERLISLLEDRARTRRLLAGLSQAGPQSRRLGTLPLAWRWSLADSGAELPVERATLHADDAVCFEFRNLSARAQHWYVQVIHVDVAGRAWLLNTRATHGLELERGDEEWLGRRPGTSQVGLKLPSSPEIVRPVGAARLVILMTSLPLDMGTLVRVDDGGYANWGLGAGRAAQPTTRGSRQPELMMRWSCHFVELQIESPIRMSSHS